MAVSKMICFGQTQFDLTGDTVGKETLLRGKTAHGADGELITGECDFDVDSSHATAGADQLLAGKTAAVKGVLIAGTMPDCGAVVGTVAQKSDRYSIPRGYHNGQGSVGLNEADQNVLIPENLREGVSCLGVTGTLREGSGSDLSAVPGRVFLNFSGVEEMTVTPNEGEAFSSISIPRPEALLPENIVKGVEIAGVEGTYEASGNGEDTPSEPKEILLYENPSLEGFALDDSFGAYTLGISPAPFTMSYGKAYRVIWDGTESLVATQPFTPLNAIAVGDLSGFSGTGNGEPFVMGYIPTDNMVVFAGIDTQTSHSVTVYEVTNNECKCETPIFAMEHMDGFTQAEGVTPAVYQRIVTVGQVFSETEIPRFLTVQWDGVSYACPVYSADGMIFVGNTRFLDSTTPDTGIPFGIVFVGQAGQMTVLATDPGTEHSVAIYSEIVECNGGGSGGGTVEGAATVTFMNGDAVYYTRPVVIGDDCPDPITQGRVDVPTKESTAQYDYTYSGWSLTDGGTAGTTNALKNVTEDRTIYAAYTSAVRYYTITYYDSDGTTVLKTESLPYGAEITYSPIKDHKGLDKWIPDASPVVGDASYTATWKEEVTFAAGSWEDIATACDQGEAAQYFAVGDTRTETINGADYTLEIIGINHDTVYSTGATTGITVWIKDYSATSYKSSHPWISSELHTAEESIFDLLDKSLQNAIKSVRKKYLDTVTGETAQIPSAGAKIWSLARSEINITFSSVPDEGAAYAKFTPKSNSDILYEDIKTGQKYWLRTPDSTGGRYFVGETGQLMFASKTSYATYCVCPCFCI